MDTKNYKIEIIPLNNYPLPDGVPKNFGCIISNPSSLIHKGATSARSLIFTNEDLQQTNFIDFKHIPIFHKIVGSESIEEEIKFIIRANLAKFSIYDFSVIEKIEIRVTLINPLD